MKKLDDSIKSFNLVFTDTINRLDFQRVGFDLDSEKVNYENCISLYDLINKFNKLFSLFKNAYKNLDKFMLGGSVEIDQFKKYPNANYRFLSMHIYEPFITNHQDTFLYLVEDDNKFYSYVTNDINPIDMEYYRDGIQMDSVRIKQYLDLFEKYSLLLDLYNYFKEGFAYADGSNEMLIKIKSIDNSMFDSVQKFLVNLVNVDMGDYIKICMNTADYLNIDINDSKTEIANSIIVDINEKDYLNILKNVYINGKYLETYYDRNVHKEKNNMKRLMKI